MSFQVGNSTAPLTHSNASFLSRFHLSAKLARQLDLGLSCGYFLVFFFALCLWWKLLCCSTTTTRRYSSSSSDEEEEEVSTTTTSTKMLKKNSSKQQQYGSFRTTTTTTTSDKTTNPTVFFYVLLGLAAGNRSLWFGVNFPQFSIGFLPPKALWAFTKSSTEWRVFLFAELADSMGSMLLFVVFLLVVVYWMHIIRSAFGYQPPQSRSPLRFLAALSILILCVEAIGVTLFLTKQMSSLDLVLYNSITLSTLSLLCILTLFFLSRRLTSLLVALGRSERLKSVRRTTLIINLFLFFNSLCEIYISASVYNFHQVDVLITDQYWWLFLFVRHALEILAMLSLLFTLRSGSSTKSGSNLPGNINIKEDKRGRSSSSSNEENTRLTRGPGYP